MKRKQKRRWRLLVGWSGRVIRT
ncbi:hypothetical protein LINPERHAP2_LOCUS34165 [Linum perenne]